MLKLFLWLVNKISDGFTFNPSNTGTAWLWGSCLAIGPKKSQWATNSGHWGFPLSSPEVPPTNLIPGPSKSQRRSRSKKTLRPGEVQTAARALLSGLQHCHVLPKNPIHLARWSAVLPTSLPVGASQRSSPGADLNPLVVRALHHTMTIWGCSRQCCLNTPFESI